MQNIIIILFFSIGTAAGVNALVKGIRENQPFFVILGAAAIFFDIALYVFIAQRMNR